MKENEAKKNGRYIQLAVFLFRHHQQKGSRGGGVAVVVLDVITC